MRKKIPKAKSQMPKVEKDGAEEIANEAVTRVATLAELEGLVNREDLVEIRAPGRRSMAAGVRRLTPAESARLTEMLEEVTPPVKQVQHEDGSVREEFDLLNLEHRKRVRKREREVRALACWWCCRMFQEAEGAPPKDADVGRVLEFVEGKLTEQILEQIWHVARAADLGVMARVNF